MAYCGYDSFGVLYSAEYEGGSADQADDAQPAPSTKQTTQVDQ